MHYDSDYDNDKKQDTKSVLKTDNAMTPIFTPNVSSPPEGRYVGV